VATELPVIDASVLVEYLSRDEHSLLAREHLIKPSEELWAPHLIDAEVGNALRTRVLRRELKPAAAAPALDELANLPLQRAAHHAFLDRAWALRHNLSFYDALYVALAEALRMPLITFDRRLAQAPGIRAAVEVLA
jgi:predicted nucleic acid-binding protein